MIIIQDRSANMRHELKRWQMPSFLNITEHFPTLWNGSLRIQEHVAKCDISSHTNVI